MQQQENSGAEFEYEICNSKIRPIAEALIKKYDELHHIRLKVRPGLTGLWRILPYAPSENDDNLDIDLQYIHSQSLLLDLSIVLETIRNALLLPKTAP